MFSLAVAARPCPWCAQRQSRRVWSEGGHFYVRCRACGGFFADISEPEYEQTRRNAWDEESLNDDVATFYGDARERTHADFLDRYPPFGRRRLLDVGCGLGYFIANAQSRGWEVSGVDTSPSWVRLANQRLGADRVACATIEQSALAPGSFDLITAWDVIEHIFDPIQFLLALRELLAPGGRIFIRTPNLAYVYPVYAARRCVLGHNVELGPTNHVVYFNARTMRTALERAGLRPTEWPVHVPPQVAFSASRQTDHTPRRAAIIAAKNSYARIAAPLARLTNGRIVTASDLDVMCVAAA
jgi:2-polyprenyl-3-methyl-5-hydroxy-6-metoxy-1,4-benzoquinol methylase